jgi:predicted dehydrogenase
MIKNLKKNYITIGLIGLGNIGRKRLLALKKINNTFFKIIYILDKKIKNNKGYYYNSIDEIRFKKVDFLIVCLPTNQVLKVLNKIKFNYNHLLLEKPGFENINTFKKFVSKLNKKKIYIKIGYNLRFDTGIIKAKNIFKKGKIGKLYSVKINYSNGTAKSNSNKVGSLLDIGSHSINLVQWLLNSFKLGKTYKLIQKNEFMNKKKDDNGYIITKLKNVIIFLHFGFCTWKNTFELELIGSKGFLKVISLPKWKKGQKVIFGKRIFPSGEPLVKEWVFRKDYSFKNELEFLLKNFKKDSIFNKKLNYNELATYKELVAMK